MRKRKHANPRLAVKQKRNKRGPKRSARRKLLMTLATVMVALMAISLIFANVSRRLNAHVPEVVHTEAPATQKTGELPDRAPASTSGPVRN